MSFVLLSALAVNGDGALTLPSLHLTVVAVREGV